MMNIQKIIVITILIIVCSFVLITCKKVPMPNPRSKSIKLNDCERCKLLTDSFSYWFDKTSRGKFEGGDADWEEKKLKSYARSEIRLVEIQEGLCSELKKHKDHCYVLSEEAEQSLEKMWFDEKLSPDNLYTWLCIETRQHCCPKSHYGPLCETCSRGVNNIVCSGNGRCDGDGLRSGKGTCLCKKGYVGDVCQDCDNDHFVRDNKCEPCDKACNGCTDKGQSACLACNTGWSMDGSICIDTNECLDVTICKNNQFCENREGSYSCNACDTSCNTCTGGGSSNCTTCFAECELWSGMCVDSKLKEYLVSNAIQKMTLYTGLCIILFFILRKSKAFASLVILVIAAYIYILESKVMMSSFKVLNHAYINK